MNSYMAKKMNNPCIVTIHKLAKHTSKRHCYHRDTMKRTRMSKKQAITSKKHAFS